MSDKDMQRAIYASLQSAARPAPRGGPNPLRSFSAIAGTRASSLPVQRPAPLLRGTGSGGGARVNRLAREAIAPAVRGNAGQREAVGAQPLAVVRTSSRRGGAVYASPYSQARVQQQQAATQQGSSNDSNSEEAEARQGQGKPGTVSIASASSTTTAPPGPEPFTGGDPQLVRQIEAEMLERGGETVSFEDIASLDAAKQLLNEAVVLPMAMVSPHVLWLCCLCGADVHTCYVISRNTSLASGNRGAACCYLGPRAREKRCWPRQWRRSTA